MAQLFSCCRPIPYRKPPPLRPPQSLTPDFEDLPPLPNLDGALSRILRRPPPTPPPPPRTPTPPPSPPARKPRTQTIPHLYRKRAFPIPELDMVAGRTPSSAWQAVAAKVVAANRARKGLGKEVRIEDFQIEDLGGRRGGSHRVFGPGAVFNGNLTFRVRKPIKGISVTVVFRGVAEVAEGARGCAAFLVAEKVLYSGGECAAGRRRRRRRR